MTQEERRLRRRAACGPRSDPRRFGERPPGGTSPRPPEASTSRVTAEVAGHHARRSVHFVGHCRAHLSTAETASSIDPLTSTTSVPRAAPSTCGTISSGAAFAARHTSHSTTSVGSETLRLHPLARRAVTHRLHTRRIKTHRRRTRRRARRRFRGRQETTPTTSRD